MPRGMPKGWRASRSARAELIKQFDRDIFKNSDFPLRSDIERLLDAAAKPEFAAKARIYLQD